MTHATTTRTIARARPDGPRHTEPGSCGVLRHPMLWCMHAWVAALVLLLVFALGVRAQPALEFADAPDDPARFVATFDDGELVLTDTHTQRVLISPNNRPIVHRSGADADVRFTPKPGGFDLTVTLSNPTGAPVRAGNITIPGLRFGEKLTSHDFRFDSKTEVFDNHGRWKHYPPGYTYPHNLYAPVAVFGDDTHRLGVSVLYPMLEYEQQMQLHVFTPGQAQNRGGLNWELHIKPKDADVEPALLAPGTTSTYTICVRATGKPEQWVALLTPYRDWYLERFGAVAYERDPRPVRGIAATQRSVQSDANPLGYVNPDLAPHVHGWQPWADRIKAETQAEGYERVMMWTPSGLYHEHNEGNFPFQFMSNLLRIPASLISLDQLRSIPRETGIDMGYWWGRSQRVAFEWDTDRFELLDPDNPAHVRAAFAELDIAVDLGATTVGLDAFNPIAPWDALRWLETLQARHPHVRYILEPAAPDFLHRLAPCWLNAYQIETEHVLADLLNPGHETWAGIQYGVIEQSLGRRTSNREKLWEVRRVARLGYTPLVFRDVTLDHENYNATDSSLKTIPPLVRNPSDRGASSENPPEAAVKDAAPRPGVPSEPSAEAQPASPPPGAPGGATGRAPFTPGRITTHQNPGAPGVTSQTTPRTPTPRTIFTPEEIAEALRRARSIRAPR